MKVNNRSFKCTKCYSRFSSEEARDAHQKGHMPWPYWRQEPTVRGADIAADIDHEVMAGGVMGNENPGLGETLQDHTMELPAAGEEVSAKEKVGRIVCPAEQCQKKLATFNSLRTHITTVHQFDVSTPINETYHSQDGM